MKAVKIQWIVIDSIYLLIQNNNDNLEILKIQLQINWKK